MIEVLVLIVARLALVVAAGCATLLVIRYRYDRTSPKARRVRKIGLWTLAGGVAALVIFFFAG